MQNQTISVTNDPKTLNPMFLAINTDPRSFFLTYIKPLFNLLSIIGNLLIVLVFVFYVKPPNGTKNDTCGLAMVSRIYYTIIAFCELESTIPGYFIRDSIYFLSILVNLFI